MKGMIGDKKPRKPKTKIQLVPHKIIISEFQHVSIRFVHIKSAVNDARELRSKERTSLPSVRVIYTP